MKYIILFLICGLFLWVFTTVSLVETTIKKERYFGTYKRFEAENRQLEKKITNCLNQFNLPTNTDKSIEDVVRMEIINRANQYGVNVQEALDIAFCESSFNPLAENPTSTAVGIYQFLDGTWNDHIQATGSRKDYKQNINQFMIWFPRHPEWWSPCLK